MALAVKRNSDERGAQRSPTRCATSAAEHKALRDEGIELHPLPMPAGLKDRLQ